jgi:hypothetical protein
MKATEFYVDLDGNRYGLAGLDAEERRLVARLRRRAAGKAGWNAFRNYAVNAVAAFYDARGVPRSKSRESVPWHIALDLCSRLGIAEGSIRPDDYRDELEELIREQFPSREAFCKATGISPTMLSHVLAGRKDLSLAALSKALARIGYRLRLVPAAGAKRTG